MVNNIQLKKLGLAGSFAVYIPASILMFALTKYLIPYLSNITGQETIFFWFIVSGIGIFLPLIITGIIILKMEGFTISRLTWKERLRFKKITKHDLLWCFAGLIVVAIFSGMIMKGLEIMIGQFDHSPAFMSFEPLSKGRYWLLIVWFPYWILNILVKNFCGEELCCPDRNLHLENIHGLFMVSGGVYFTSLLDGNF